jgi:two-component sensor histidine kinase
MNLLKSFYNTGVYPNQDPAEIKMVRTINLLAVNTIVCIILATIYSYFFQNNKSSLYTLLSLPLFAFSIYLNAKRKILMAITILFLSSSFLLTIYSLRTGEDANSHMLFVLNIMGLSLLYRKEKTKLYFNISLYFTITCILFVLISYKMHWFEDFKDSTLIAIEQRELNFYILLVFSLIYSFVIITTYRQQYKQMQDSIEEQKVLLAEVNHRVKNNLAVIISLLNMQKNATRNSETKNSLQDVHDRIMSMALVHQKMYQNKNKTSIELANFISDLVVEIRKSLDLNENILYETMIDSVRLDISIAIPIGLILNELITNSIKHAFHETDQPNISITLTKKVDVIEIIMKDNGMGATVESLEHNTGIGMSLIQSLVDQIDGKYSFEGSDGLTFTLAFPNK